MLVLAIFALALCLAFGYALVGYLDAAPELDEDAAWQQLRADAELERARILAELKDNHGAA